MPLGIRQHQVERVVIEVIPPAIAVPAALLAAVAISYKFNRFWRWLRLSLLWSNPDNFVQLAAGSGVNLLLGDRTPVRVAALMVWVPSRVVDCADNYNKLGKAYVKWVEAIRGDYPRRPKVRWVRSPKGRLLPPAWETTLKEKGICIRIRVQRVIVQTVKVGKRVILLSVSGVDVVEALSLKEGICNRAVSELLLDGTNAIHRIAKQKGVVQRKLEENRPLVDRLLKWVGASYSTEGLIDCVETALDGINVVDQGVTAVTSIGNGFFEDLRNHAILGVFSILGIPEKVPEKFLPISFEERFSGGKASEQYVPDWMVTKPERATKAVQVVRNSGRSKKLSKVKATFDRLKKKLGAKVSRFPFKKRSILSQRLKP